ncbi:MAG: CopG family transcriptional regulator, partial [Thermoplasmata archaeon]
EVIANMDEDDDDEVFSKEDEEKVKERLRALGYLD